MKYILRTLWLIGYIPVFIFECIIFLIMIFVYPLAGAFYFIKTGSCENCPFIPSSLYIYIDKKYKELLKHNGYLSDNVEPTDYNSIDPHFGNPVDNVEPKFKIGDTMRTLQEAADGYTDGMPVVISVDKEYYHCTNELIAIKDQDDYEFPPMNRIQTHTDKVEPKFKVGDWCIDNEDGIIFQIVKVLDKTYRYRTNEGKEYSCARYSLELDARLWNISDTKEGDVLVDSLGNVCIYQEPSTKLMYHSHCYGNHKYFIYMGGSHEIVGSYPATKEQRDKFEKSMADAGYTFDFEKKKLKKLKFKVGDEVITKNEKSLTITKIDEKGYWSDDLFICNFDSECNWNLVEQKPDDKVESKFKVGDYVVDNCGYVWRIEGIINQFYILEGIDGGESRPTIEWVNKTFHLWDIKDAKDGDVLVASDGSIFLFAGVVDCACKYYAALATDDYVKLNKEAKGGYWETSRAVYPATKEQRDKFEKSMAESGYEFDFDKKELKKIEQNPEYARLTEFEEAIKDMMNDYRDAIGDSDATTEEVKKHSAYLQSLISQTPAKWGDEDEKNLIEVICILQNITSYDKQYDGYIDWLKSLRPKQQ